MHPTKKRAPKTLGRTYVLVKAFVYCIDCIVEWRLGTLRHRMALDFRPLLGSWLDPVHKPCGAQCLLDRLYFLANELRDEWAMRAPRKASKGVSTILRTLGITWLAAAILGLALGGCSRKGPAPDVSFLPTAAVETEDKKAAFEAAKAVCLEQAQRKGISSVTRILLFKGKISESEYVDCMESKGFAELE